MEDKRNFVIVMLVLILFFLSFIIFTSDNSEHNIQYNNKVQNDMASLDVCETYANQSTVNKVFLNGDWYVVFNEYIYVKEDDIREDCIIP